MKMKAQKKLVLPALKRRINLQIDIPSNYNTKLALSSPKPVSRVHRNLKKFADNLNPNLKKFPDNLISHRKSLKEKALTPPPLSDKIPKNKYSLTGQDILYRTETIKDSLDKQQMLAPIITKIIQKKTNSYSIPRKPKIEERSRSQLDYSSSNKDYIDRNTQQILTKINNYSARQRILKGIPQKRSRDEDGIAEIMGNRKVIYNKQLGKDFICLSINSSKSSISEEKLYNNY